VFHREARAIVGRITDPEAGLVDAVAGELGRLQ
jgi:hypothetical protein